MALIVQKYGGTSVANHERIRHVAERVLKTQRKGNKVVVVASAMAGETNRLIKLATDITELPDLREYDQLISTGENVACALLAITIQALGGKACSLSAHQVPIIAEGGHKDSRIKDIDTKRIKKLLDQGYVVVVTGFQGVDQDGNIHTLGRGGSDTSAVAVAAALKAELCEIYTDVDGVYTTDPNVCPQARKIDEISYEEIMEMASSGAKVLQIRSVELAKNWGVKLAVLSSFEDKPGTMIVEGGEEMEQTIVSGVAYDKNEAKITVPHVPDRPGVAAMLFKPLGEAHIIVDMIVQNASEEGYTDMTFTVRKEDLPRAKRIAEEVARRLGAREVRTDTKISKVSIVGVGMRSAAGVAAKMFETLAKAGVNIQMISTSEIKVSCVIEDKYTELAVRELHAAFGLEKKTAKGKTRKASRR